MIKRTLTSLILVMTSACGGGGDPSPNVDATELRAAPIDTTLTPLRKADEELVAGLMWPIGNHAVHSREAWLKLWQTHRGPRSFNICEPNTACTEAPAPVMPEFDFSRYTLIAIFGNYGPGHSVRFDSVRAEDGVIVVRTIDQAPTCSDCFFAQVQQDYFIGFLIPATRAPVRFVESGS